MLLKFFLENAAAFFIATPFAMKSHTNILIHNFNFMAFFCLFLPQISLSKRYFVKMSNVSKSTTKSIQQPIFGLHLCQSACDTAVSSYHSSLAGTWWSTVWLRLTSLFFPVSSSLFRTGETKPLSVRRSDQAVHDAHTEHKPLLSYARLIGQTRTLPLGVGQLLSLAANVTCHTSNKNRVSASTPSPSLSAHPDMSNKGSFQRAIDLKWHSVQIVRFLFLPFPSSPLYSVGDKPGRVEVIWTTALTLSLSSEEGVCKWD